MRTVAERTEQARAFWPALPWRRSDAIDEARDVRRRIVGRHAYCDLAVIWTTRFLTTADWRALQAHCPGAHPDDQRLPKKPDPNGERRPDLSYVKDALVLPQPSKAALLSAHDVAGRGYKLIENEEALDFETAADADKAIVGAWCGRTWWQPRRPEELPVTVSENVTYSAQGPVTRTRPDGRKRTRPIPNANKQYDDKPNRWGGGPCHHLDHKISMCRTIGLNLIGLANRDRREFWRRVLQLRDIDFLALARAMRAATGKPGRRGRADPDQCFRDLQTGRQLAAAFAIDQSNNWGCPDLRSADAVTAYVKMNQLDIRMDRILKPIPNADFLPDGLVVLH